MAILEYAASDYVDLAYTLGQAVAIAGKREKPDGFGGGLDRVVREAAHLGLPVTLAAAYAMIEESSGISSEDMKKMNAQQLQQIELKDLSRERYGHHFETLITTLRAELSAIKFRAIPRERTAFCDDKWLMDTEIPGKFPTSFNELTRAGNCYGLGEATACVFHSMRALEPPLGALATHFGKSFAYDNWHNVIEQIESAVRDLGRTEKTPGRIADEKFFGSATAHLYFVKGAWRNHAMHTRDKYIDKEAVGIMQRTADFIESLCQRLSE